MGLVGPCSFRWPLREPRGFAPFEGRSTPKVEVSEDAELLVAEVTSYASSALNVFCSKVYEFVCILIIFNLSLNLRLLWMKFSAEKGIL